MKPTVLFSLLRGASADLEDTVAVAHRKGRLGRGGRSTVQRAVAQVKARALAGTDDLVPVELTFAQRASAVRATIMNRVGVVRIAEQEYGGVGSDNPRRASVDPAVT